MKTKIGFGIGDLVSFKEFAQANAPKIFVREIVPQKLFPDGRKKLTMLRRCVCRITFGPTLDPHWVPQ